MLLSKDEFAVLQHCATRPIAGLELPEQSRQDLGWLVINGFVYDFGQAFSSKYGFVRRFNVSIFKTTAKGMALLGKGGPVK